MKRRSFIQNAIIAGVATSFVSLSCARKMDSEIIILGGGISGLYLAYLLESVGLEYILLEGSNRLGGRLFTHPEIKRDVGGRGIGDKYKEIMALVNALEVPMIDISDNINGPSAVYLDGKLYKTWEDFSTNPAMLQFNNLKNRTSLVALNEWYQKPKLDEPYLDYLKRCGKSDKELDLINHTANYNDIATTSSVNAFHSSAFRTFNGSKRILNFEGGTQNFIGAIHNTLTQPCLTDKFVTSIADHETHVIVACDDGSTYKGKKVISTLPFSTLRDVNLNASVSVNQKKAIDNLAYTKITQIHLNASEKFWEQDETPASMWTDTPIERIMDMNPDPEKNEMVCWVNGKGTAFFDGMSEKEISNFVLKTMKDIRPASEGKLEYVGTHNWSKYKYNKGAYCEFLVGQAVWFNDMIKPAGNIHFAGEHTGKESRGIEAAAESARRVFNELIDKKK